MSQIAVDKLFEIQNKNRPQMAAMPYAKEYVEVDLRSRVIGDRPILSAAKDHKAESVYFITDRYWDYMDLSTTTCIIQYKTYPVDPEKQGVTGLYAVPYYDIYSHKATPGTTEKDRMVIPWCIDGRVTQDEADVEYAIRFFRVDTEGRKLVYNLNTTTSTGKVLYGLDVRTDGLEDASELAGNFDIDSSAFEELLAMIQDIRNQDVFWIEFN